MLVSYKKDLSGGTEERIDDDLDFEAAKFTNTLHKSCSRPVAEMNEAKGSLLSLVRPSAGSCFYLRDE